MDYFLFTWPNCPKCDALKAFFSEKGLPKQEYDVGQKEGRLKIREFIRDLKRDESGAVILPTLVCADGGRSEAVLNSREEFETWLRSRG